MRLSIIIPCWNRADLTLSLLTQLNHLPADHEIIVIDNNSTDVTANAVTEFTQCCTNEKTPTFIFISNQKNEGYAKACNQGYQRSRSPNILFMNNDVGIERDYTNWTNPVINLCETEALIGASACWLSSRNFIPKGPTIDVYKTNTYLEGWFIAASKKTLQTLTQENQPGPWNEKFFLYFEDTDLSMRAHQRNIPLILANLPITHLGHQTTQFLPEATNHYRQSQKIFQGIWWK